MAVLSSDTLTGCSSIPSFLGGSADTPANPTVSVFRNTNAPTNWVKKTTHDNKALRIIGGANGTSLSPGGSSSFTTVLTSSKPFPGSFTGTTTGLGAAGANPSGFVPTSVIISFPTTNNYSPASPDMSGHSHPTQFFNPTLNSAGPLAYGTIAAASNVVTTNPSDGSSGTVHSHPVTFSHTHSIQDFGHTHPVVAESQHTHTFSGNAQNFAVTYVDIIIATKS